MDYNAEQLEKAMKELDRIQAKFYGDMVGNQVMNILEEAKSKLKDIYLSEFSEEVIVYVDCLNADNRGDLVRCSDCGELMLMQIGGTSCGECESENLEWYDEDRQEWTMEELEEEGFIITEK